MSKACARCKTEKEISCFNKNVHSKKDGLSSWCRECQRAYDRAWREKNHEKHNAHSREYYRTHKAEYRDYRQKNKEERIAYSRAYREFHREYLNALRRLKRRKMKMEQTWDAAKIDPQQLKPHADVNNAQLSLISA